MKSIGKYKSHLSKSPESDRNYVNKSVPKPKNTLFSDREIFVEENYDYLGVMESNKSRKEKHQEKMTLLRSQHDYIY